MTMEMSLSEETFVCEDSQGNGCGRLFDSLIVNQIKGLCESCAEDLPMDEAEE